MRITSEKIIKALKGGNKILICGNGGSATQASHFAGELVGRFKHDRIALPAISLAADLSTITAIANDYGYKHVFSRQIEALGKPGDILVVLSTSGKSENCVRAADVAEEMGLVVIELPRDGTDPAFVQEMHLVYIHEICDEVERAFLDEEV